MNYRKAILIHGVLIPVLLAAVVAIIILVVSSRLTSGQQERSLAFDTYESIRQQLQVSQNNMIEKRPQMRAWSEAVAGEFRTRLNVELPRVLSRFSGGRLEQTSDTPARGGSGLNPTGGQPATRITLQFQGGYEAMQLALLELENRLPQMQLESLTVQPDGDREKHIFQSTYTAWESPATP